MRKKNELIKKVLSCFFLPLSTSACMKRSPLTKKPSTSITCLTTWKENQPCCIKYVFTKKRNFLATIHNLWNYTFVMYIFIWFWWLYWSLSVYTKKIYCLLSINVYNFAFINLVLQTTPFVRQNTPHPKELKAKAHKLFGKTKSNESRENTSEETVSNLKFCEK